MATPKVFISSTCFDLSEIRDQLKTFVSSFGFDPILSEHGDVFYHPDLHTHEACVNEVSNCQLFILIIGGRYGGVFTADKDKSITNAEYVAAREAKIPVFTYIRKTVLDNHHLYNENKASEFIKQIKFPAIDKQKDAEHIFKFVDEVRRAPVNNAFEGFENFNDIETHLRKQWAGMFFDFLKTREIKSQMDVNNHLLNSLNSSNMKLEELVKSLYLSSSKDSGAAADSINDIEINSKIKEFFELTILHSLKTSEDFRYSLSIPEIERIAKTNPAGLNWVTYLVKTGLYVQDEDATLRLKGGTHAFWIDRGPKSWESRDLTFEKGIKMASQKQRFKALKESLQGWIKE